MKVLPMGDADFRGLAHIAAQLDFFKSFKGGQLERIFSHIDLYAYEKGETIFHKGGPPTAFYLIYQGRVRIHLGYRFLGVMKRMAHLKDGDMFGEMAIMEKRKHAGTAVAEMPTKIFVLPYEDFDNLMQTDPEFADLMRFVSARRKGQTAR
jgi:signal-transduction protein with cAMP-binding, CBS, and nucleotidyltransferase domain